MAQQSRNLETEGEADADDRMETAQMPMPHETDAERKEERMNPAKTKIN